MFDQLDGRQRTATVFNDNTNEAGNMEWYGIADMTYMPNGEMHATTLDMDLGEPVITRFNADGTRGKTIEIGPGGPTRGLALEVVGENYIMGGWRQFHEVDMEGNLVSTTTLSGSFTPAIELTATAVQNFTRIGEVIYKL